MTNDSFLRYAKEKGEKMITSLNINQSVTQNTTDYISKQLKTKNDIVLLHDVTRDNIKKISENNSRIHLPYAAGSLLLFPVQIPLHNQHLAFPGIQYNQQYAPLP